MAIFSVSIINARKHVNGKAPVLRVLQEAGDLPKECLLPGDFEGDGPIGKLPKDAQKANLLLEGVVYRKFEYHLLPQLVADRTLALALDVGPAQAHRLLQRALGSVGMPLTVTGTMDAATRRAVMMACSRYTERSVVAAMRAQHEGFCRQVAAAAPKLREHLDEWMDGVRG